MKHATAFRDYLRRVYWKWRSDRKTEPFPGSAAYWEKRYASGGNSGVGSYDFFAEFKAEVLNQFVAARGVKTVIEFGSGDGNQLRLAQYPTYVGYDVSSTAVESCRGLFRDDATKSFHLLSEYDGRKAELALSLDVIYHLVEDRIFETYMRTLFGAAEHYVVIYSSNTEDNRGSSPHVRHRNFTRWIDESLAGWRLAEHMPNKYPYRGDYRQGSFADFFIYEKTS